MSLDQYVHVPEVAPPPTATPSASKVRDLTVAIVGTGFSGLGMAVRLLHDGETDFLVFERATSVGGTWRDNTYPGCACDVAANLYSFSFAPNRNWKNTFGTRAELYAYLNDVSVRFGVESHIRFDNELLSAKWDDVIQRWRIETSQGSYTARVLVSGMGYLSDPNIPALPGLESFQGTTFHSQQWDHDYDLTGKRVAVIGTGASAIQFVPEIQPVVGQLDLYQRSAPWIGHKPDKVNKGLPGFLLRHAPGYQTFRRGFNKWGREFLAFTMGHPKIMAKMQEKLAVKHLDEHVKDPAMRAKLTPDYIMGCKRLLFSNSYYQAVIRPSVDVVTDGIREIRADSIVTEDGTVRPTDAIIFGTGFKATKRPAAQNIWGLGGVKLADAWADGQTAYVGTTVSGFPNLFLILGPNTTLAHSAMTLMSEAQIGYAGDFVGKMKRQGIGSADVKPEVQTAYNAKVQAMAKGSVWNAGGCASWYLDAKGNNTSIWPTFTSVVAAATGAAARTV